MSTNDSRQALIEARNILRAAGSESPYLDALLLLSFACNVTREHMYARLGDSLTPAEKNKFRTYVSQRAHGKPIAYITGYQEFFGLDFFVDQRVLVPRSATETLVEAGLESIEGYHRPYIHDCCTGSGCVAIALAANRPDAVVSMSDFDKSALNVAKINSTTILERELRMYLSDLLTSVPGSFDLITCNPPYLTSRDMKVFADHMDSALRSASNEAPQCLPAAPANVPAREPRAALDGGADGLVVIERLCRDALASLRPNGYIIIEAADSQAEQVEDTLRSVGYVHVFVKRDLAGNRRVIGGRAWSR